MYSIIFVSNKAEMRLCVTQKREGKYRRKLQVSSSFKNYHKVDGSHVDQHIPEVKNTSLTLITHIEYKILMSYDHSEKHFFL